MKQNWELYKYKQIMTYPQRRRRKIIIWTIVIFAVVALILYLTGASCNPKGICHI